MVSFRRDYNIELKINCKKWRLNNICLKNEISLILYTVEIYINLSAATR